MRRILAALPLLLSAPAMAGTYVAPPVRVAPIVRVAPMIHTAPIVHTTPGVHTAPVMHAAPAVHATPAVKGATISPVATTAKPHEHHHQPLITVPVAMNSVPKQKQACGQQKPGDAAGNKACAKK